MMTRFQATQLGHCRRCACLDVGLPQAMRWWMKRDFLMSACSPLPVLSLCIGKLV